MKRTTTNEYRYGVGRGQAGPVDMNQAKRLNRIRQMKMKVVSLGRDCYTLAFYPGVPTAHDVWQVRFHMTLDGFTITELLVHPDMALILDLSREDVRAVAYEKIHENWSAWHSKNDAAAKAAEIEDKNAPLVRAMNENNALVRADRARAAATADCNVYLPHCSENDAEALLDELRIKLDAIDARFEAEMAAAAKGGR